MAGSIEIKEVGAHSFQLAVTFDGQRFECGSYVSRAEAQKAGSLFVKRKEGEQAGRKKRPRKG
jgi:hypothetical protein